MNPLYTTTNSIDHESLAMLLDEVTAIAASGRSLTIGLADLDQVALGKIGRAAQTVRQRMEQGQSASAAIASLSHTYQAPIRGAMLVMARTGSTRPLRETVRLIREANERRQQMTLAVINPLMSIVVAATVVFLVIPWILVSLSEADLVKSAFAPTAVEISHAFVRHFFLAVTLTLAVIAIVAASLYAWQRRAGRISDVADEQATFCRWLALQIEDRQYGEVETGRAIETSAEVVGPQFAAAWTPALERIRGGAQTAESMSMPRFLDGPLRQCVVDLVAAHRDRESIALDLQQLSELYADESRRRRAWWIETVPKWVAAIVMVAVILILIQAILAPLLDVINEVAPMGDKQEYRQDIPAPQTTSGHSQLEYATGLSS